jgi:hypothetical protein
MKTKLNQWTCWLVTGWIMMLALAGRADNPCLENITTNNLTCLSAGTWVSNYVFTPTSIGVGVGHLIIPPTVSHLAITNGQKTYYVTNLCTPSQTGWYTNSIDYTVGNLYFVPTLPQVIWDPGTYIYTGMVVAAGSPCSPLTNTLGTLTVTIASNTPDVLLNVDFGSHSISAKTGYAAIGNSSVDFWNGYAQTNLSSGSLINLLTAEGTVSPIGMLVTNLPVAGTNGSSDAMYNDSLGTNAGMATVTLTNLPVGIWNVYLYATNGNFSLSVGGNNYGTQSCYDVSPGSIPLVWQQGVQYVAFQNVVVTNGQPMTITLDPGTNGAVMISGLQIASFSHTPPLSGLIPSGMVSWWRAQNNALDSIGTNNGTLMGGANYTNGLVGQAFNFNGANAYVAVPASSSLNVGATNGFTFETWINPVNLNPQAIAEWNDNAGNIGVHLWLSASGSGSGLAGNLYANLYNGANHLISTGGGLIATNSYQHIALTYDKTSGIAVLYRNGTPVQTSSLGTFTPQTSYNLYLGTRLSGYASGSYFRGAMDESSLYNRALSTNEIAAIYQVGDIGKSLSSTVDSDYDGVSDMQELVYRTNPNDPNSVPQIRLGHWRFDNTNTWAGETGQLPITSTNIVGVPSWRTNAVLIDNTNMAILKYRDVETNGNANINLRNGSVRFWFKPDWDNTLNGGTGPQSQARLIEIGGSGTNTGWWTLLFDSNGTNLSFVTQTNGVSMTNLTCLVNWNSNSWHQIAVTYCGTNSSLYLDGQPAVTNGNGAQYYPSLVERTSGFTIGSDKTGTKQARGQFEELETLNYFLSSSEISSNYLSAMTQDNDGNGLPDFWEWQYFGCGGIEPNADMDGDGVSNLQEYQNGTNPIRADTDYDGRSDSEEIAENTDPLDSNSFINLRLGYWRFNDTNSWVGEQGQLPIGFTNIAGAPSWSESALLVSGTNSAYLKYHDIETNGAANLNLQNGTIRFWYKPQWSSVAAGGTGPQSFATVGVTVGRWTTNGVFGYWGINADSNGGLLSFVTQGGGSGITNLQAPISWVSNQWHQITITYSLDTTYMYIDGEPVITNGFGVSNYPALTVRSQGFSIGSDMTGSARGKGEIEELETFNYLLEADTISHQYTLTRPTLDPPTLAIFSIGDGRKVDFTISHSIAEVIIDAVANNSYPNPVGMDLENNYSSSFIARQAEHFDSSSIGINITKLPQVIISPNVRDFDSATNITINLGMENLTNLIEGLCRTELGRASNVEELTNWLAYAQTQHDSGLSDEGIRADFINQIFRNSVEYTSKNATPIEVYPTNNNYIIEFSTNGGSSWLVYSGAVQVAQSVSLQARVKKTGYHDSRADYVFLTSEAMTVQFTVIPTSWLIEHFGTNYFINSNAIPYADPDNDGLLNWREQLLGTDPNNPDTDGDGRGDGQELIDGTNPLDANSISAMRIGYWRFDNTNTWIGEQGQIPISFTNLAGVPSWNTNALQVDGTNQTYIKYSTIKPNGNANILCRNGTIRFWFKPSWSGTNAGGNGPGAVGRMIEIGHWTSNATYGHWAIQIAPEGTSLTFDLQSGGVGATPLQGNVQWHSNEWHQVVVTYSSTNSAFYVDGTLLTNGMAFTNYPGVAIQIDGFTIGSDFNGSQLALGQFEELESFNYPLSLGEISTNYTLIYNKDSDGDGLTDLEEGALGLDPFNPDTGNTGKRDGRKDSDSDLITNLGELRSFKSNPAQSHSLNTFYSDAEFLTLGAQNTTPVLIHIAGSSAGYLFWFTGGDSSQLWEPITVRSGFFTWTWMHTGLVGHPGGAQMLLPWASAPPSGSLFIGAWVDDTDHDGLSNVEELHTYGTVLDDPDTDNDGISDGDEVLVYGTDPLNPDTDGDGMSDGLEIELGRDPKQKTANTIWFIPTNN